MTLETPDSIRELQKKLYRKAKQEKEYRFYLLYDKVYRRDILSHPYCLMRANKGAPGVDGETFEGVEKKEGGVEGYLSVKKEALWLQKVFSLPSCCSERLPHHGVALTMEDGMIIFLAEQIKSIISLERF